MRLPDDYDKEKLLSLTSYEGEWDLMVLLRAAWLLGYEAAEKDHPSPP